jgi:type VI protein secretion system component Hcp
MEKSEKVSNEKAARCDPNSELTEEELARVAGGTDAVANKSSGKVAIHDISITKMTDKSSP